MYNCAYICMTAIVEHVVPSVRTLIGHALAFSWYVFVCTFPILNINKCNKSFLTIQRKYNGVVYQIMCQCYISGKYIHMYVNYYNKYKLNCRSRTIKSMLSLRGFMLNTLTKMSAIRSVSDFVYATSCC